MKLHKRRIFLIVLICLFTSVSLSVAVASLAGADNKHPDRVDGRNEPALTTQNMPLAMQYVISGSVDGTGVMVVDDHLDVYLNGNPIFIDNGPGAGNRAPISFTANIGDSLNFQVRDTFGVCSSLSRIYITDAAGGRAVADAGFNLGCGRPSGNQGVVHNLTFVIPELTPPPAYTEVLLTGSAFSGVVPAADGRLYGVTYDGPDPVFANNDHDGTLYRYDPGLGTVTMVHNFNAATDGSSPYGELVYDPASSKFYGAASEDGPSGVGTIFTFDPFTGAFVVIRSDFQGYSQPQPPFVLSNGYIYGSLGRPNGAVFRMLPNGTGFTLLHEFEDFSALPQQLTLGPDGRLYGATIYGGIHCDPFRPNLGCGTLFRLRAALPGDPAEYQTLHQFQVMQFSATYNYPQGRVFYGSDGMLYGTTYYTVFKLSPSGSVPQYIWNDPGGVSVSAIEGADGRVYVSYYGGGPAGAGTVFSMMKDGTDRTALHNFTITAGQGYGPYGRLYRDAVGTIYGTTEYSIGGSEFGTVFAISGTGVSFPPIANPQPVIVDEEAAVNITLTGSGGGALSYSVTSPPTHGVLSGTAPNVTYTPFSNYNGPDSFMFNVSVGPNMSAPATVSISVTPVNDAPVANNQAVTLPANSSKAVVLSGSDIDGDVLTYSVATPPAHGTLAGMAPNLTYTPFADYTGPDAFTFRANDGMANSGDATVSINVTPLPTFVVSRTDDRNMACLPADCSLREAITLANNIAGHNQITFSPAVFDIPQTVDLTAGELLITDSLTLAAAPNKDLTIRRSMAAGTPEFGIFRINGAVDVTLNHLTIANGKAVQGGGILNNGGTLTLNFCVVSGNRATNAGGGILSSSAATLTLNDTRVEFNNVNGNVGGGLAIFNGGTATFNRSKVTGNTNTEVSAASRGFGGGIGVLGNGAVLNVFDSTVSGNIANTGVGSCYGGGVAVDVDNTFNMTKSTVSNNTTCAASPAISRGGGLYLLGNASIRDSVIYRNSAPHSGAFDGAGGGIFFQANLSVSNSTISGNSAANFGGGIANIAGGLMTVFNNVTIAENSSIHGGGISNGTLNPYRLRNTLVARNSGTGTEQDIADSGVFVSNGNNLIGTKSAGVFINGMNGDQSGTTASPLDPKIGPLGLNGGTTFTHPLTAGSTAINGGNNCVYTQTCAADGPLPPIKRDQRGVPRTGSAMDPVEIGAFEHVPGAVAPLPNAAPGQPFNVMIAPSAGNFGFTITNGTLPPGLMLNANRMARSSADGTEIEVSISGTPAAGSTGTYNFTLTATDGTNTFSTNYSILVTAGAVAGNVTYSIVPNPVPGVALTAAGSLNPSGSSALDGSYTLTNFGAGSYTVTPAKAAQPCAITNGILANDASLVSRYVVGLETFTAAQLAAARVGGVDPVSSLDAGLIARRVVGLCDAISLAGQWRFTPVNRMYTDVLAPVTAQNYAAIMLGDVSGDWAPTGVSRPALTNGSKGARASLPAITAMAGLVVELPLKLEGISGVAISSYQFEITYDPAIIEPAELAVDLSDTLGQGLSAVFNAADPGSLRVAVYGAFPAAGNGVYAKLRFRVKARRGSSQLVIRAFGYNDAMSGVSTVNGSVSVRSRL